MPTIRQNFLRKTTVMTRAIHIALPVEYGDRENQPLTMWELRDLFKRRLICLLIWGEGGSGKTSLACLVAQWAMIAEADKGLRSHPMIPVLIEDELPEGLHQAVRRQVQDLTDQASPVSEEFLDALLRKQRVLVIVDRLSELSAATRAKIAPGTVDFPVNALVVTSRSEEALGGISKGVVKPMRIEGGRQVSTFVEEYLIACAKRNLFSLSEFFEGCGRLATIVGGRNVTVLLARLYADQMTAAKEGALTEQLPGSVPELMLSYLNQLNRTVAEERMEDRVVHRTANAIAWVCVKDRFVPGWAQKEEVFRTLGGRDAEARAGYFESRLRLVET
jgi:hypothetical protein